MSKIRRLSIAGIRNIPDTSNPREIAFTSPITLILGDNGTGKTTIIECLKYITTGDFPPGSDKGKSFIYAPTLSPRSVVRAMVRVEIIDKRGNVFTIYKSMEAVQREHTVTIKHIDNTITRIDETTRKTIQISNKCADTNAQVCVMMGVSKSILNYVIFCHQDESFWPLEGGKDLKERLDEIFGTVKYNKAMETVRNTSKYYDQDVRGLEAEKKALEVVLGEVKAKEIVLATKRDRCIQMQKKIQFIEEKLKPVEEKLKGISDIETEYKQKVAEEGEKKMKYKLYKEQVQHLRSSIDEIYEGTDEELTGAIESYQRNVDRKSKQIKEIQKSLSSEQEKERKNMNALTSQRVAIGVLQQQMLDQKKRIDKRNNMLREALSEWNIDVQNSDMSENDITALTTALSSKYHEFEQSIEQTRKEREELEKEMQRKIDKIIADKSCIESEMKFKVEQSDNIQKELQEIRNEILRAGAAALRLTEIEEKYKEACENYDSLANCLDTNSLEVKLNENVEKLRNTETVINEIDEEIKVLHRQSSIQAEIEILLTHIRAKEQDIQKIKEKHEASLKRLLETNEIPVKKLRNTLEAIQKKLDSVKKGISGEINQEQRRVTTLETTLRLQKNELKIQKDGIEEEKNKVSVFCAYTDYDEMLKLQSKKVKSLQEKQGMFAYQRVAYKKYLEEMDEKDPCCPTCKRGFKHRIEIEQLKQSLKNEMSKNPETLQSCNIELKDHQAKYNKMLQLKPIVDKIMHFENVELQAMTNRIRQTNSELASATGKVEMLQLSLVEPQEKLTLCENVIKDIILWDDCINEMEENNKKINTLQQSIDSDVKNRRTITAAQKERDFLKETINKCRKRIEDLQSQLKIHNEKLRIAYETKISLQEQQLTISSDLQKVKQFKQSEKELREKESVISESVYELQDKVLRANQQLKSAVVLLENSKKETRKILEENHKLKAKTSRQQYELSSIQQEIDRCKSDKIEETLRNVEMEVKNYETEIKEIQREKTRLEKELDRLNNDISLQEVHKKQLMDNVILRKKESALNNLKQECISLRSFIVNMKFEEVIAERENLLSIQTKFVNQKNVATGGVLEVENDIKELEKELRKEEYRTAAQKYKKKCIEAKLTKEVVKDLNIYAKALDKSITEYHQDRIATVNRVMYRLWSSVYTGNDIMSIQIRANATRNMDAVKRQFNYKLVQVKDSVEMDMKGKCSAGQRVLASIVVRMALAETFCSECGVLTLDEPTTNLDEHNSRSLAEALSRIVDVRAKHQKNFQLIVISHDEDFVQRLAKFDYGGSYYQLYRSPGSSIVNIRNLNVQERQDDEEIHGGYIIGKYKTY